MNRHGFLGDKERMVSTVSFQQLFILIIVLLSTPFAAPDHCIDEREECGSRTLVCKPVRGRLGNHFYGYVQSLGLSLTYDIEPLITKETQDYLRRYFIYDSRFRTSDEVCGFTEHYREFVKEIERLVAKFYDEKTGKKNVYPRDEDSGRMRVPPELALRWHASTAEFIEGPDFWRESKPNYTEECAARWEVFWDSMDKFRDPKWNRNRFLHIYPNGANVEETVASLQHPKYYEEFHKDMQLKPKFLEHGQRVLSQVKVEHLEKIKKVGKKPKKIKKEIMFVGIHCRRTDHIQYEKENDMIPLTINYYIEAMSLFQDKFQMTHHVVFIFVSDDIEWGKSKISKLKAYKDIVYFVGNNDGVDPDAIGNDLGLLVSCNHTIQSHGTYSDMAGFLAGGLRVIPHHFQQFRSKKHRKKKYLDKNPLDHPLEGIYYID